MASICFLVRLIAFLISISVPMSFSQTDTAPPPSSNSCNGIYVAYTHTAGSKLRPYVPSTPSKQPYRFESTITLLNNGREELKSWRVFVGFQHNEILVSASNAVLADGGDLPGEVGDGAVLAGSGSANLKTAIETAGDATQMGATIDLVGTVFGVGSPSVPMPKNISLANDGFKCPKVTMQGKNQMYTCCIKDANATSNATVADEFLPLQKGDLTIMYDITKTYGSNYWAQVTIENHHSLGRLDGWRLSWLWMRDEFIYAMKGAYPSVVDSNDCIFGKQGQYYQAMDFSTVLNCERRPTIIDLPLTMANETKLGKIPHCCRDGIILPKWMDPSKSVSAFQVNVFKMAPDLNSSALSPPQSFQIKGTLNPNYKCGPPVRVTPSQFEDPSGLPSNTTAIASWQVACNITRSVKTNPRCCVSFSAYYNESVIPCRTCACGCPENSTKTCSATAPALLLPTEASLRPFENRSALAIAWAALKHRTVPKPLPCGDNCGVSMNWHLYTDYTGGWSARITLFNWEDNVTFVDWFAAVQMNKAAPGFEKLYSFNGTTVTDVKNTIFMQGLSGLNYLVAEADGATASALRVPGKQQSVISFTKKGISGMNLTSGDGFPAKVYFNGEECMLPKVLPISIGHRVSMTTIAIFSTFIMPLFLMFMQY